MLGFKTNQHNNIDIVLLLSDSYLQALGCNTQHISPLLWWIYIAYHIQRYFRAIVIWHKTTSGAYQADQKKGLVWHYHIFHHGNIATLWTSPNLKLIKVKFIKLVFWFRFLFMQISVFYFSLTLIFETTAHVVIQYAYISLDAVNSLAPGRFQFNSR